MSTATRLPSPEALFMGLTYIELDGLVGKIAREYPELLEKHLKESVLIVLGASRYEHPYPPVGKHGRFDAPSTAAVAADVPGHLPVLRGGVVVCCLKCQREQKRQWRAGVAS